MEEVKEAFPDEFAEVTKKMEELKIEDAKRLKIKILYGNKHRLVPNPAKSRSDSAETNKHEWIAFVTINHEGLKAEDLIESVTFELHETFRNPIRKVSKPPFQLKTKGWGTFEIPITIKWKKAVSPAPTTLSHYLSFDGEGAWKTYTIRVHADKLKPKKPQKKISK